MKGFDVNFDPQQLDKAVFRIPPEALDRITDPVPVETRRGVSPDTAFAAESLTAKLKTVISESLTDENRT